MNRYNIIIVGNDIKTQQTVIELLSILNVTCLTLENGNEALNFIFNNKVDIIITDIDLPDMEGTHFCRILKEKTDTQGIPIIIVSHLDSITDINRGLNAGATAYINIINLYSKLVDGVQEELRRIDQYQGQRILVADDSKMTLSIIEDGLQKEGFKVISAIDGKNALEIMKEIKPSLILSDIMMPGMDGFGLLREISTIPGLSSIPFIAMSTKNERAYVRRMILAGATSYITKPFNIEQLVVLIENIITTQFLLLLKERERLNLEQKQMLTSITSLISALEARDPYTRGHSESVSRITASLTKYLDISEQQRERIIIGARLHDIGKIGIKDKVLIKPGPLTNEEYDHIKQHPIIGVNIIKNIPNMEDIIPIIQFHHERYDGKGYPVGLKKKEIPLFAHIVAIADTYDSLTSDRPYRKKKSTMEAFQIIKENRGTQFDPDCVDLFYKYMFYKEGTGNLI